MSTLTSVPLAITSSVVIITWLLVLFGAPDSALSTPVNPNFVQKIHWDSMGWTVALRFSPGSDDVFAAEKNGQIRWYSSINAKGDDYRILARVPAHQFDDRGLLGLAIHPQFPSVPHLFALYTDGFRPGQSWVFNTCPSNEFVAIDGLKRCAAKQKLVRLEVDTTSRTLLRHEEMLVGWCMVGTSHAVGDLKWASDGSLLLSAGDGSTYQNGADSGVPGDGCYDVSEPKLQGAFRSQYDSFLHGKLLQIFPQALGLNRPLISGVDFRIVAKGLRNPYRIAVQPTTGDVFIGDVGASAREEINRVPNPTTHMDVVLNMGWPCMEGTISAPDYVGNEEYMQFCQQTVENGVTPPFFEYRHGVDMPTPDPHLCRATFASPTGIAFYPEAGNFGTEFKGTMFMLDDSKRCVFYFEKDEAGEPDPNKLRTFVFTPDDVAGAQQKAGQFVDVQIDRMGNMYLVDIYASVLHIVKRK